MSSSADPLLSSLCRICNINTPKYKCPRCTLQTCSLACAKRHKLWSQCSGVRDVTAFVPRKELFTSNGINNDYNFITSIERGIERADRVVVHEKGLVPKRLDREPTNRTRSRPKRGPNEETVEIFDLGAEALDKKTKENAARRLAAALQKSGVNVQRAPLGIQRNKDNKTHVNKSKHLNWQVEWITDDGNHRLDKLVEGTPLGWGYEESLILQARAAMDPKEVLEAKKRKAKQYHKENNAKRRKIELESKNIPISAAYLQDAKTALWNVPSSKSILPEIPMTPITTFQSPYYFYLLRPFTPSSQPKILIPLDSSKPLSHLLRHQVVLEFPTIYVSSKKPKDMPRSFMMEKNFLAGERRDMRTFKNKGKGRGMVDYSDSESDSSESDSEEEEGSSDDSSDSKEEVAATSWSESASEGSDEDGDANMGNT